MSQKEAQGDREGSSQGNPEFASENILRKQLGPSGAIRTCDFPEERWGELPGRPLSGLPPSPSAPPLRDVGPLDSLADVVTSSSSLSHSLKVFLWWFAPWGCPGSLIITSLAGAWDRAGAAQPRNPQLPGPAQEDRTFFFFFWKKKLTHCMTLSSSLCSLHPSSLPSGSFSSQCGVRVHPRAFLWSE